ncbi:MAG TPA: sugar ABC transporter substrate-binding protein [Trebonia sp.]|nr:sugar ABC transporter substrate-binding protein [Trebonia sp.]
MLLSAAAACSSSGSSPSSAASPASSTFGVSATGTVQFWARSATKTLAQKMVSDFNATHKNLQVKLRLTSITDDVTSLATSIRAGDPPDVDGLNDIDVTTFTRNGSFMDLTSAIDKLPYKSALSPGHLALATYQGKEYGVPFWGDLSVLWYNKTLFTKAGLDPNKPPTTYAEILSDAQAINKLGGGVNGFTFAGNCQGCLGFTVQPGIWADGTHLTNGDIGSQTANITGNTPLQNALTLYRQLWTQHLVPDNDRTDNGTTWGQDFAAGKIGIMPGGYGQVVNLVKPSQLGSEFMDTPLPGSNGGYSTFDGGDDFVIPNGAKNASGAWEFIQWVMQTQQQDLFPSLGATPVRTDVLTPSFSAANPEDAVALKALAKGYAPVTLVYDQMFNQAGGPWLQMFTTAVYNGNMSLALQQGQSGLTRLLQQAS